MVKNITTLLQKGNLTPKERVLLLVANKASRDRDGKSILTEADEYALSEGWTPKNNNEVKEYNRFNAGCKLFGQMSLEAEIIFLQTKADHFRKFFINMQLNFFPFYQEARRLITGLEKIKVVNIKEAIEITNKQREQKIKDGLDFDYAVYTLAYDSLGDDFKQDLKALCGDVEYDASYLEQEEIIANLFNGKDELTKDGKEKLAELISNEGDNKFTKKYNFNKYFASIPIQEIVKKWAKDRCIKPSKQYYILLEELKNEFKDKELEEDLKKEAFERADERLLDDDKNEILENYAKDNQITVKNIIKETCLKWLDDGLLIKNYTPIFNSKQKDAYNGETKYQHDEIFKKWVETKNKAKEILNKFVASGDLKIATDKTGKSWGFGLRTSQGITITGESLYKLKGDYKFLKDFKERVDKYDANWGLVYADDDPEHKGSNLDKELLIADKNNKGELTFFSNFGLTVRELKQTLEITQFFKEIEKDGETFLGFNNETVEKIFKEIRESLINCYAKQLAFKEILKRLSKTYETDLTFFVVDRLKSVDDFIDQHNDALNKATGQKLHGGEGNVAESWTVKCRGVLKLKENLFINKDKILPDINTLESWGKQFEDILGDDF